MKGRARQVTESVVAALAVAAGCFALVENEAAMTAIRRMFAASASAVLNLLGQGTVVRGSEVLSAQFGISVVTACTGVFLTGLFLVAVSAYPVSWRARATGAGLGILGLYAVNVLRLVSLFFVGVHWPTALEPIHQLVWQSLVIGIAVAMWLAWAARAARRRPQRGGV
ncbi:MAG: hypothetical protein AB1778_02340 [Candidatus Bipolaricaulota bacterium]